MSIYTASLERIKSEAEHLRLRSRILSAAPERCQNCFRAEALVGDIAFGAVNRITETGDIEQVIDDARGELGGMLTAETCDDICSGKTFKLPRM